jgi:hypothetical protein
MASKKTPAGRKGAAVTGKPKRPPGRPTLYTEELAVEICRRVAEGASLRALDADPGLPSDTTLLRWLEEMPEFRAQYARAKERLADRYAEDVIDIADDAGEEDDTVAVQRAKLRVDARKWAAGKLAPKKYGNKLEIETGASLEDALRQIAEKRGLARGG